MSGLIGLLFKKKGNALPPAAGPSAARITPSIPDEDDEDDLVAADLQDMIGCTIGIEYVDSRGYASNRRVTIRGISTGRATPSLHCFCHEREAARQFRFDRIKSVIELHTGEVFDTLEDWMRGSGLDVEGALTEARDPIKAVQPGLQILALLAHCDGDYDESEHRVIINYVNAACQGHGLDADTLSRRLRSLHPDEDNFYDACDALQEMPKSQIRLLIDAATDLIKADGIITDDEREWLDELEFALE